MHTESSQKWYACGEGLSHRADGVAQTADLTLNRVQQGAPRGGKCVEDGHSHLEIGQSSAESGPHIAGPVCSCSQEGIHSLQHAKGISTSLATASYKCT